MKLIEIKEHWKITEDDSDEEIKRKGLFRRKTKISHAKHLVVFVTPTIVEPEGNPVNARK